MQDLILQFLTTHVSLVVLGSIITVLKVVFHPLMKLIENAVTASGNAKALDLLNETEASKWFTFISWLIDYVTSIDISTVMAGIAVKSAPAAQTSPSATPPAK